jgi:hypothetical protein
MRRRFRGGSGRLPDSHGHGRRVAALPTLPSREVPERHFVVESADRGQTPGTPCPHGCRRGGRLEADGLLTSEQRVVDGRTRRVYKTTEAGKQALAEDRKVLAELVREVLGGEAPA